MKTCEYCGSRVENGVTFCPHCGASKFKVDEKPSSNLNTYTSQNTYTSHGSQGHHENKAKGESKVLGIMSIIFAFIVPIVGFILSIISLAKYKDRSNRRLANIGLIISIIKFIISL